MQEAAYKTFLNDEEGPLGPSGSPLSLCLFAVTDCTGHEQTEGAGPEGRPAGAFCLGEDSDAPSHDHIPWQESGAQQQWTRNVLNAQPVWCLSVLGTCI